MAQTLTRRAALALLTGAITSRAFGATPGLRFSAIKVDVSPMRAKGDAITAGWIAADLPELLRQAFADQMAPGDRSAPVLVARIDSVFLGEPGSAMQSMISTHDYIEGAAVVDYGGRRQTSYPLTTSTQVSPALIETPNGGELRVLTLAGVFARFLPGQIGL